MKIVFIDVKEKELVTVAAAFASAGALVISLKDWRLQDIFEPRKKVTK